MANVYPTSRKNDIARQIVTLVGQGLIDLRFGHRAGEHCLGAVGADGDDLDGLADELADAVEIAPSARGEVFDAADFGNVGLPAGERLVDRLTAAQIIGMTG